MLLLPSFPLPLPPLPLNSLPRVALSMDARSIVLSFHDDDDDSAVLGVRLLLRLVVVLLTLATIDVSYISEVMALLDDLKDDIIVNLFVFVRLYLN